MKRIFILFLLFLVVGYKLNAQFRGNNWIFGDSIYIRFNGNSSPTIGVLNSDIGEPYSSISDSTGDLLFYSGSRWNSNIFTHFVYDKFGNYMQNSGGINGFVSGTQGSIIVPFPDSANLYYLFTNARISPGIITKAFYNIIDMNQNGGLGSVIVKNQLLNDSNLCEMMAAVKHANGRDWWLVLHQRPSPNYFIYLITPNGISNQNLQPIGLSISTAFGEAVFSEDGSRFVQSISDGNLQLLDFDRCTGIFGNCIQLGDSLFYYDGYYGCSFSKDGTKLYSSYARDSLFQFDLTSSNIKSSRSLVYAIGNPDYGFGQHELAENGKIYLTHQNLNNWQNKDSITTTISIIESPDSLGAACSFQAYGLDLDGKLASVGLPNNPNYALGSVVGSVCDSLTVGVSEQENDKLDFKIYPNPARDNILIRMSSQNNSELQISDLSGKILKRIPNIKNNEPVYIADLSNGIYIVSLKMKEQLLTRKMVVIH